MKTFDRGILPAVPISVPVQPRANDKMLLERAQEVAGQIRKDPGGFKELFHPAFLKAVPEKKVTEIMAGLFEKYGRITSVQAGKKESNFSAKFIFQFTSGSLMEVSLTIEEEKPFRVIGLFFHPISLPFKSIQEVVEELKKLPGQVNFKLVRLGFSEVVLGELNSDKSLAIGSTFKLYILGALAAHGKNFSGVVKLREEYRSFPSGNMHTWPAGSPVTVHTLAAKMISESDNTATDHLLHYAGRKILEEIMKPMGHRNPALNKPFISTAEMFKLKSDDNLMARYKNANEEDRRKILAGPVASMPREKVQGWLSPREIEHIEWFASASDLVRLMDWMRLKNHKESLEIMAINPGINIPKENFSYAGFKGGSEAGVLNLTWLLKSKKGHYYALTAGWNNPKDSLDEEKFAGIIQSAIRLIEP